MFRLRGQCERASAAGEGGAGSADIDISHASLVPGLELTMDRILMEPTRYDNNNTHHVLKSLKVL